MSGRRDGRRERLRRALGLAVALTLSGPTGCGGPHSTFADPASEAAAAIGWLWWVLLSVTLFVFLAVLAGWLYALRRRRPEEGLEPEGRSMMWILIGGAIIPAVLLLGLTVATIRTSARLAGGAASPDALLVEVVAHQFWWEVRYPESGAVTANEIHVPVGRPVRLRLTTNDVIHSFWVPRLHGKLDMTPGRTSELVLQPDEAGIYRGFCAEFCGRQHALMGLRLVAQSEESFTRWLAHNAAPAAATAETPAESSAESGVGDPPAPAAGAGRSLGEELFVSHECHLCHRVRGAAFPEPLADVGPDLTHVGSRETLGAATIENTPSNLAEWVRDPHQFKPGVRMPATPMPDAALRALAAYLADLQ